MNDKLSENQPKKMNNNYKMNFCMAKMEKYIKGEKLEIKYLIRPHLYN